MSYHHPQQSPQQPAAGVLLFATEHDGSHTAAMQYQYDTMSTAAAPGSFFEAYDTSADLNDLPYDASGGGGAPFGADPTSSRKKKKKTKRNTPTDDRKSYTEDFVTDSRRGSRRRDNYAADGEREAARHKKKIEESIARDAQRAAGASTVTSQQGTQYQQDNQHGSYPQGLLLQDQYQYETTWRR